LSSNRIANDEVVNQDDKATTKICDVDLEFATEDDDPLWWAVIYLK
jgi:hypothetical protein